MKIILLVFLSGCFGASPKIKSEHEGKAIPSVNLILTDSTNYNTTDISTIKPTILFFFSPYCPHCRALTNKIIQNMSDFDKINFLMISNFPLVDIRKFQNLYKLQNYHNITVALDDKLFFNHYFKLPGVPCMAIYNDNKVLKQVIIGNVKTSKIKEIVLQ